MPRIAVAVLAIVLASAARAQVRETVDVRVVEVPVTVVDRAGNPVRGLTRANFELLDRGVARPISSFDAIDFAAESLRSAPALNPAARRNFILTFDLSFSSPASRRRAQEAARNFVARSMGRRDLAAVATIDVDRGFRMVTALTTDRELLGAAIANPRTFVSADPLRIAGSSVIDGPTGPAAATEAFSTEEAADVWRVEKRLNDDYNRQRLEREVQLLRDLAGTVRNMPGRKQVIFFSEGFDPRLVRGRDARAGAEEQAEMFHETSGAMWRVDTESKYGSSSSRSMIEEMARAFRGSDVILHGVDIQGVRVQNDADGARINSNDALYLLARPTGGEVFKNSNDVGADLQKMLRAQEVVYVLGFRAAAANDGRFHELRVRVKGVPGARVVHRAGYYDTGGETALERSLTNAEIILNDIPQNDVRIALLAAPFPHDAHAQVPVVIDIDAATLAVGATTPSIVADVYLYAFGDDGVVRDRIFQRLTIDRARLAQRDGVKYIATMALRPGTYAVKALVSIVGNERKGFARTDVTIAGAYDVALLPPLFVDDAARWIVVRGTSHDGGAAYPFHINGEPFMPSATAHVANGHSRRVAIFVANAGADEVEWSTAIGDDHGGTRAATPALIGRLQGQELTKLLFDYTPADLRGSAATFGVTVKKRGSTDARTATVPLIVDRD